MENLHSDWLREIQFSGDTMPLKGNSMQKITMATNH